MLDTFGGWMVIEAEARVVLSARSRFLYLQLAIQLKPDAAPLVAS
jgi:hypothetical protein